MGSLILDPSGADFCHYRLCSRLIHNIEKTGGIFHIYGLFNLRDSYLEEPDLESEGYFLYIVY